GSLLRNASRGLDHVAGEQGMQEWTAIGRIILTNWQGVIEDLDDQVRIVSSSEFDEETVTAAASKISTAKQAAEDKRKELEDKRKAQKKLLIRMTDPHGPPQVLTRSKLLLIPARSTPCAPTWDNPQSFWASGEKSLPSLRPSSSCVGLWKMMTMIWHRCPRGKPALPQLMLGS